MKFNKTRARNNVILILSILLCGILLSLQTKSSTVHAATYTFIESDFYCVKEPHIQTAFALGDYGINIASSHSGANYTAKKNRPSGAFFTEITPHKISSSSTFGFGIRKTSSQSYWHGEGALSAEAIFVKVTYPNANPTKARFEVWKSGSQSVDGLSTLSVVGLKQSVAIDNAQGTFTLIVNETGIYVNTTTLYAANSAAEWASYISSLQYFTFSLENEQATDSNEISFSIKQVSGTAWSDIAEPSPDGGYHADKDNLQASGNFRYNEKDFNIISSSNREISVEHDGVLFAASDFGYEVKKNRVQGDFNATLRPGNINSNTQFGIGITNSDTNFWHGNGTHEALYLRFTYPTGQKSHVNVTLWKSGSTAIGDIPGELAPFISKTITTYTIGGFVTKNVNPTGELRISINVDGIFVNGMEIFAPSTEHQYEFAAYVISLGYYDISLENTGRTDLVSFVVKQICGQIWNDAVIPKSQYDASKDINVVSDKTIEFNADDFKFPIKYPKAQFIQQIDNSGVGFSASNIGQELVSKAERMSYGANFSATLRPDTVSRTGWIGIALRASSNGKYWHEDSDVFSLRFIYPDENKSQLNITISYLSKTISGMPLNVQDSSVYKSITTYKQGLYNDKTIDPNGELRLFIDETGVYVNGLIIFEFADYGNPADFIKLFNKLRFVDINMENRGYSAMTGIIVEYIDSVKWINIDPERVTLAPLPRIEPSLNTIDSITIMLPNYNKHDAFVYNSDYEYVVKLYADFDYNAANTPIRMTTITDWLQQTYTASQLKPDTKYFFTIEAYFNGRIVADYFPVMERTKKQPEAIKIFGNIDELCVGTSAIDLLTQLDIRGIFPDNATGQTINNDLLILENYNPNTSALQTVFLRYNNLVIDVDIKLNNKIGYIKLNNIKETYAVNDIGFDFTYSTLDVVYIDPIDNIIGLSMDSDNLSVSLFINTEGLHTAVLRLNQQAFETSFSYTVTQSQDNFSYEVAGSLPQTVTLGQDIDVSNININRLKNGVFETSIQVDSSMLIGYDKTGSIIGEISLYLQYNGIIRAEYSILVKDKASSMVLVTLSKNSFFEGQTNNIDLSNNAVKIYYLSGAMAIIPLPSPLVTLNTDEVLFDTAGRYFATLQYYNIECNFEIEIYEDFVNAIKVTAPAKLVYFINEEMNRDQGSVLLTYASGKTEKISLDNEYLFVRGFSTAFANTNKIVTIIYEFKNNIFSDNFSIKVLNPAIMPQHIEISQSLNQLTYKIGEELNLKGGKVTITFLDGSTEILDITDALFTLSGFSSAQAGTVMITVTLSDGITTTFTVNIVSNSTTILFVSLSILGLAAIAGVIYFKRKKN